MGHTNNWDVYFYYTIFNNDNNIYIMDLKDKIVGLAMACLIALIGWQLHETWSLKEQVFKLQQGQTVLSKQIKKNTAFVKQKLKQLKKKQNKKTINKEIKKNNKKKNKKKKQENNQ